jgi:hypothetical protein
MDYRDLRLDGNAAAGMLGEVFTAEMTSALGACAGCGATNALGAVQLYAQAPGAVMRCPSCEAVLLCVTRIREDLLVDLSGLRYVRILDRAL